MSAANPGRGQPADDQPKRHIRGDLRVSGVLRVGGNTIVEGSIVAPGGVVLGDHVVVEGDIHTQGAISMGIGCRILGQINPPPALAPSGETLEGTLPEGAARDPARELRFSTLETSLGILLSLAQDEPRGATEGDGATWGLPEDALEDMVAGLKELMAELYRGGDDATPWRREEIFEVFLRQTIGLLAPVSVTREDADRAVVRIGRPQRLEPELARDGWVAPLLSVIATLGRALSPDFRIDPVTPIGPEGPNLDPSRITAMVRC